MSAKFLSDLKLVFREPFFVLIYSQYEATHPLLTHTHTHMHPSSDIRTQQQKAATSHFLEQLDLSASKPQPTTHDGRRCEDYPYYYIQ